MPGGPAPPVIAGPATATEPTYDGAPHRTVGGALTVPGLRDAGVEEAQASSVSSRRLRVRFTSTGMPGPMVVDTVILVM